jgi:hypothetical protein
VSKRIGAPFGFPPHQPDTFFLPTDLRPIKPSPYTVACRIPESRLLHKATIGLEGWWKLSPEIGGNWND